MNSNFEYLTKSLGSLTNSRSFSLAEADALRGRLPSGLLEFWLECGIGMWASGKFQFCNPDFLSGVLRIILQGDPEYDPEKSHVIGFGAFGDLLVWNEQRQKLAINLPYLRATADSTVKDWKPLKPDDAIMSPMMRIVDETSFTLFDDSRTPKPLFRKCLRVLGPLDLEECYGLFPAIGLGGKVVIANIKRVKAREHFAILAQLGPVQLVDFTEGRMSPVRPLGSQPGS